METEWLSQLSERIRNSIEKIGIYSASSVLLCSESQLCRQANLTREDYRTLLIHASKFVTGTGFEPVGSALRKRTFYLTTGCDILDKFLKGGISVCGITEIAGESGCGKTQLCMQLSLTVQYPFSRGGLDAGCVYICTEDVFPHRRLQQLFTTFTERFKCSLKSEINFGDNIYIEHISEPEVFKHCVIARLPRLLSERKVRLIIIDSVAGIYRNYESGDAMDRAQELRIVGAKLHYLAQQYQAAVVCVNQVTAAIQNDHQESVPALGLAWANMVTTRLQMFRAEQNSVRQMVVIFSPYLPCSSCKFIVSESGVAGII